MPDVNECENDYVTRVLSDPGALPAADWDRLLAAQDHPTPFVSAACLGAFHASGSAVAATGWAPHFVSLWRGGALQAACPLYIKDQSFGEYVFDWAWAQAYAQHGLHYYPKAVIAVPFTPVPGSRLLAVDDAARHALLSAAVQECRRLGLSSLHLLFASPCDLACAEAAGLMRRTTVQFHWTNRGWPDFEAFLSDLRQDKRKKIRQERRRVREAGVRWRHAQGRGISAADWSFFYRCYERTYLEHGNLPYLTPAFFEQVAREIPDHWLMFIAERDGHPIAGSLIALGGEPDPADPPRRRRVAWGRYWGALERVDCLHFEACYYQPIEWCIAHDVHRFEGGAQGEHKLARALLPVLGHSAHWLAHPAFADAVARFLARESQGVDAYRDHLESRTPMRVTEIGTRKC